MKPSLLIPASLLLFPLLTMAAAPKSKSSPDLAAQAGNEFAFELFAKIAGDPANQDKNLFISPHSISTALSMALEGARGKTQEEMALALGLGDPKEQAKFMASLKALAASLQPDSGAKVEATRKELASLREKLESLQQKHAKLESENKYDALFPNQREQQKLADRINELSQEIDQYELNLANGIWVEQSAPISEAYLQTIQDTFGTGGAQQADFAGQPDVERQKINAWAAEQTRDRIPEVLPPGSVDPMTIAILANAIYFKGNWESPFDKERTKEAPFLQSGGRKNHVDLMNGMKSVGYAAFQADGTPFETPKMHSMDEEDSDPKFYPGQGGFQIAELAYRGDQISMVILLPTDVDGLAALEAKLNSESLSQWLDQVAKRKTQLSLPKFKMEGQYSLRDSLSALGMGTAFGSQADFSGITGADSPRLQLSDVHHATFIQVDEVGTEAAAVTAVGVAMTALPVQVPLNPIFRADHPFLFLIRDQVSGAILFLGRMMDPVGA